MPRSRQAESPSALISSDAIAATATRAVELQSSMILFASKHLEIAFTAVWHGTCNDFIVRLVLKRERKPMITQSISCDMCGVQKREANHWFIAYKEAREIRISGWASPRRLSAGTAHLCGERCVHRFLSDFIAHAPALITQPVEDTERELRVN